MKLSFALLLGAVFAKRNVPGLLKPLDSTAQTEAAGSVREKGYDLLFGQDSGNKNVVISPLSIIGCMYMLAAGSAGETRTEILEALNFADALDTTETVKEPFKAYSEIVESFSSKNSGYTLNIANGMFYQEGLDTSADVRQMDPAYLNLLKEDFIKDVSNIQELDFRSDAEAATNDINTWINRQTNGKIPKLFSTPLDADTLVVLASSLYFKASWVQKFRNLSAKEAEQRSFMTSKEQFLEGEGVKDVKWMQKIGSSFYTEIKTGSSSGTVIEIPLKHSNNPGETQNMFVMQIWLPTGLITDPEEDKRFQQLIRDNHQDVRSKMGGKKKCNLILPKFSINYKNDITKNLKAMNIKTAFSSSADLSPILGEHADAYVKKVTHAVKFDVDENGIEGAAVTVAQINSRTFSQPKMIEVNKPFYFMVTNRCWDEGSRGHSCDYGNVPLFMGKVVDPTQ